MVRSGQSSSGQGTRKLRAVVATTFLVALALGPALLGASAEPAGAHVNTLFYADWEFDRDFDGVDDRLEADAAAGKAGEVMLHLHYDRRPTADDKALLEGPGYGARRAYVFDNWDDVKVETDYASALAFRGAPGVVMVEWFEPPMLMNDVGVRTLRAAAATGVPEALGVDHLLAVHETLGYRGEGMVIAVLDTGVDNTHESLDDLDDDPATDDPKLVQKTLPDGSVVVGAADGSAGAGLVGCTDPVDDESHGTHVAGTALGTGGPSKRFMGVAPQAKLVDIDVAVSVPLVTGAQVQGTAGNLTDEALDWLINFNDGKTCYGDPGPDRIDVVTWSFGTNGASPNTTTARKITDVVRHGMTFTVAAGNSGPNARTLGGSADGAIFVANDDDRGTVTRTDDRIASSSSRGPRGDDADGDTFDELLPHVAAPGTSITSALFHSGDLYIAFSGTSMATPMVAGVAALMLQANPALRPVDQRPDLPWSNGTATNLMGNPGAVPVRDLLEQTAHYRFQGTTAPQFTQIARFGLPWNNAFGYGLVDAYAAVLAAKQLADGVEPLQARVGGIYAGDDLGPVILAATVTGGTPPYLARWVFGDASPDGEGLVVAHPYPPGKFLATVVVTDAAGLVDAAATQVTVAALKPFDPPPGVVWREFRFEGPNESCSPLGWFPSPATETSASTNNPYQAAGDNWHLVTDRAASVPCSWYHGVDGVKVYNPGNAGNLNSPGAAGCFFLPPGSDSAHLYFEVAGESEVGFDFLTVQVRSGSCLDDATQGVGQAGTYATYATYDGVQGNLFDVPPVYAKKKVSLEPLLDAGGGLYQIRFRFIADVQVQDTGFHLDNLRVYLENGPPVLAAVPDQTGLTLDAIAFALAASDPDGDPLTFRAEGLPAGATLDPSTGAFAWTPTGAQSGTHLVTFTATDGAFTSNAVVATLVVQNRAPLAAGSSDVLAADRLTPVRFTDASADADGSVLGRLWDFGDGASSTERDPAHTYASLGTFTPSLTVTDDDGASAGVSLPAITVANLAPTASLSSAPSPANRVDPTRFAAQASDRDGSIASYAWAFGDGGTGSGPSPRHTYAALGTFPVTLTVADNEGGSAVATGSVQVVNLPPGADFRSRPAQPMALLPTLFEDLSRDRDGTVVAWRWDFGDGATSTAQNPLHTYASGAVYRVTLSVTDSDGGVGTVAKDLLVCSASLDVPLPTGGGLRACYDLPFA